ncbi:MAG: phospholipase effector Tle1 domain-containing protein [Snowella sp.]
MAEQRSVLKFNGVDDHIELSQGFSMIDNSITIAFWAKGENNLTTETTLLEGFNRENNRVLHITLPWGDSVNPSIFWDAGNEEGFDRIEKKVKLKDYNNWTYWAFVKNAIAGRMLIYRNGIIWHRGNGHNRTLTGIEKITLGASVKLAHHWQGYLTELSIWNQARSQEEIQKDMYQHPLGDEIGLVTYLSLNGNAEDQTSYGNNAILYGTTWQLDSLPPKSSFAPKSKTLTNSRAKHKAKKTTMINDIFNAIEEESSSEIDELAEATTDDKASEVVNSDSMAESESIVINDQELLNLETSEVISELDKVGEGLEQDSPVDSQELSLLENSEAVIIAEETVFSDETNETIEELSKTTIPETETSESIPLVNSTQKKRLIVCCDGSWQESAGIYPSNVVKFSQSIKYIAEDQTPQIVFLSGYGTTEDNDFIKCLGNETFGWGLDRVIQEAYRFLSINYNPETQDEIYLLGFSRGAYAVRSLASLIDKSGLLKRSKIVEIPQAYQLYRDYTIRSDSAKAQAFREANAQKIDTEKEYLQYRIPITMLGCWDTVGTLGIPDLTPWFPLAKFYHQKYEFSDTKVSPIVQNAFHAVAIDEKRKSFPSTPIKTNPQNPEQVIKEVLFAGDHSCLGGGTKIYQGLSDYPLQWMINQARKLGLDFNLQESECEDFQVKLDPTIKFDNNVKGLSALGGEEWRSFNTKVVTVHHSVVKRLSACSDYRPKSLEPFLPYLLNSGQETE